MTGCKHLLLRGARKGQQCGKKTVEHSGAYCRAHASKYAVNTTMHKQHLSQQRHQSQQQKQSQQREQEKRGDRNTQDDNSTTECAKTDTMANGSTAGYNSTIQRCADSNLEQTEEQQASANRFLTMLQHNAAIVRPFVEALIGEEAAESKCPRSTFQQTLHSSGFRTQQQRSLIG